MGLSAQVVVAVLVCIVGIAFSLWRDECRDSKSLKRQLCVAEVNANAFNELCKGLHRNCDVSVTVNGVVYLFRQSERDIVKFTNVV